MLHIPKKALLLARKSGVIRPQDVFQPRLITGSGATRTENVGFAPDLIISHARNSGSIPKSVFDTNRGALRAMYSNTTAADAALSGSVTEFNSTGYSLGNSDRVNGSFNYLHLLLKTAEKFFIRGQFNHTAGTANNISFAVIPTPGMIIIKAVGTTSNWYVWHRSMTTGNNMALNSTAGQTTTNAYISVNQSTGVMTFAAGAPTATYQLYAFAHEPTGIIQCGSYTLDGGSSASVNLGWRPQFLLTKHLTTARGWAICDSARGFGITSNLSDTAADNSNSRFTATAQGFSTSDSPDTGSLLYMAIKEAA